MAEDHHNAWSQAGHLVIPMSALDMEALAARMQIMVQV